MALQTFGICVINEGLTKRAVMIFPPFLLLLQLLVHHHSQNGLAISKRETGYSYENFIFTQLSITYIKTLCLQIVYSV